LPRQEIGVGPLNFGFAVDATQSAKAVNYELGGPIRAVGHFHWRPASSRHTQLHQTHTGNLSTKPGIVPAKK
jgi:hypothetical protein